MGEEIQGRDPEKRSEEGIRRRHTENGFGKGFHRKGFGEAFQNTNAEEEGRAGIPRNASEKGFGEGIQRRDLETEKGFREWDLERGFGAGLRRKKVRKGFG